MDLDNLTQLAGPRWITIEATALEHNFKAIKNLLKPTTRLLAVVKADAYGAGAVAIAQIMEKAGADYLGVTTLAEGLELRRAGIILPILVMSPLLPVELPLAIEAGLTLSVSSLEGAEKVAETAKSANKKAFVHLKLETGLQRTGLLLQEALAAAELLNKSPYLKLEGIYSHLAEAARQDAIKRQFAIFKNVLKEMEEAGFVLSLQHICSSSALLAQPEMELNMVRIGTLLYGQFPCNVPHRGLELQDIWKLTTRILFIHEVTAGTPIGYGGDFISKKPMRLAVIPIGYADGFRLTAVAQPKNLNDLFRHLLKMTYNYFSRHKAKGASVVIDDKEVKVIGRVGMQLSMIDISHLVKVRVGQEVAAELRHTTASTRLARVYCYKGEPYLIRTATGEFLTPQKYHKV